MIVFYEKYISEGQRHLSEEESKHCAQVLRKKTGDYIQVFDGMGGVYTVVLTDVNKRACKFEVVKETHRAQKNFKLHLAIAPTKNIDRMEWMVEKLGELGVDEITFLKTENSERTKLRIDRLERKAVSAMKQSKYPFLTRIYDVTSFKELIQSTDDSEKWIAHVDHVYSYLGTVAKPNQTTLILIGPEGDFSPREVQEAAESGFQAMSLGQTTLRTETAGLAACHFINVVNHF